MRIILTQVAGQQASVCTALQVHWCVRNVHAKSVTKEQIQNGSLHVTLTLTLTPHKARCVSSFRLGLGLGLGLVLGSFVYYFT